MERWGVFSVIDHKDDLRRATELLLYDKIAVPTPMAGDGDDWGRWQDNGWEPDKLMKIVERLTPHRLVIETDWNLDRQKNWRQAFEEAKADIDKVSAQIQSGIDQRVAEAERDMAGRSKEERDKAVQARAWAETRNEIIRHLKGGHPEGKVEIYYGPVEFYAAYQSKRDFEQLHPDEDPVKHGIERVNFLIQHQLAVPDKAPEELLDCVIELVTTQTFKERRRKLYDFQIDLLQQRYKPEQILSELNQHVRDFNAQALAHDWKCRWETVITVLGVSGGALAALAGFYPSPLGGVVSGLNTAGIAVWRKFLSGKEVDAPQRIAAPGAMFHQMEADTGFEFRTRRSDGQDRRPQRF